MRHLHYPEVKRQKSSHILLFILTSPKVGAMGAGNVGGIRLGPFAVLGGNAFEDCLDMRQDGRVSELLNVGLRQHGRNGSKVVSTKIVTASY